MQSAVRRALEAADSKWTFFCESKIGVSEVSGVYSNVQKKGYIYIYVYIFCIIFTMPHMCISISEYMSSVTLKLSQVRIN